MIPLEQNPFKSWQKLQFKVTHLVQYLDAFILKWNSVKHNFNRETFYAFWEIFQATHLVGAMMFPLEENPLKLWQKLQFNIMHLVQFSAA